MKELSICVGSACHLKGSYDVIDAFKTCVDRYNVADKIVIKAAFCFGVCTEAVAVKFDETVYSVTPQLAESFFTETVLGRI